MAYTENNPLWGPSDFRAFVTHDPTELMIAGNINAGFQRHCCGFCFDRYKELNDARVDRCNNANF